jgi:hypothetical protein
MLISLTAATVVCAVGSPIYIWYHNRHQKAQLLNAASVLVPGLSPIAIGYGQYEAMSNEMKCEHQCLLGLYRQNKKGEYECSGAVYIPPYYLQMIGRMALKGALNQSSSVEWGGVVEGWEYDNEDVEQLLTWLTDEFCIPEYESDFAAGIVRLFSAFGNQYGTWASARMTELLLNRGYNRDQVEEIIMVSNTS